MGVLDEQINRLGTARNKIRTWLIKAGLLTTDSNAKIDSCANEVMSIPITQSLSTVLDIENTDVVIPNGYQINDGLVSIELQEKTVTLGDSAQTIVPDQGKVLSKVHVPATPKSYTGSAIASHVLSGDTFTSERAGTNVPGTMSNYSSTSLETNSIQKDSSNLYFGVPKSGYFNTSSNIYTSLETLFSKMKFTHLYSDAAAKAGSGNGTYGASVSYTLTADYDFIVATGARMNVFRDGRDGSGYPTGFQHVGYLATAYGGECTHAPDYTGSGTVLVKKRGAIVVQNAKSGDKFTNKNYYTYTLNGEVDTAAEMSVVGIKFEV